MEYLIGSLVALVAIFLSRKIINAQSKPDVKKIVRKVSQSYVYEKIKPAIPVLDILERMKDVETQSRKFEQSLTTRVLVLDNEAYWIKDNSVYSAFVDDEGIDSDTTQVVDMINMDDVQLEKMMFIIEKLTEGLKDDSSNTGNKDF